MIIMKNGDKQEDQEKDTLNHMIFHHGMKSMKLPASLLSLYLELFLFWFVTEQSHKWSWDPPSIDDEDEDGMKKQGGSRWERMTKQMKVKLTKIYEEEDAHYILDIIGSI